MPTNVECIITIEQAIEYRNLKKDKKLIAKCPECRGDVHPMDMGASAHFEHLPGNKDCKLSDHNKSPNRYRSNPTT